MSGTSLTPGPLSIARRTDLFRDRDAMKSGYPLGNGGEECSLYVPFACTARTTFSGVIGIS